MVSLAKIPFRRKLHITATLFDSATGTVTFYDGGTSIGTGTISDISATLTTSSLAIGTHNITATWPGDAYHSAAASNSLVQVISIHPGNHTVDGWCAELRS